MLWSHGVGEGDRQGCAVIGKEIAIITLWSTLNAVMNMNVLFTEQVICLTLVKV